MKLNPIPIPKRFMLHGQVINVVEDKMLSSQQGNRGECRYDYNEIRIQPALEGAPMPDSKIAQAFCHELIHMIFYHAELNELAKDEEAVNLVSELLQQALATAEYK